MTNQNRNLMDLARRFHEALPARIRQYLNARGIPDELIGRHLLGWNGWRITIPIFNRAGEIAFFKQARDPEDPTDTPKMIAWPRGTAEIYGWEHLREKSAQIIICEGEFDRLVLEANGFPAVTTTGGAGFFRFEWAKEFAEIPEIYIAYDNDEAGRKGARRLARMMPQAKVVELPEEVGEGGDVTDFFVRLGLGKEDFLQLMAAAKPLEIEPEPEAPRFSRRAVNSDSFRSQRVAQIKSANPIGQVIGQYMQLRPSGSCLIAHCPFHEDRTASFAVYPKTDTFYCYGCGKHGDVISFLREIENLSFGQALDTLDHARPPYGPQSQ